MAKLSKKRMSEMGTKITGIAKKIRKESPNKKWTTCITEAGKKYKKAK